jgi:hypothetical protein
MYICVLFSVGWCVRGSGRATAGCGTVETESPETHFRG